MPHAVCWAAAPRLIWTMVVANFVTFASYLALCGTLLFIVRRTFRVMSRDWALFVVGFALFIVACGSTHLMDVVTTWIPVFWMDAVASIVTAVLSACVALMLMRRAGPITFAVNDYAERLRNTEQEKDRIRDRLLSARKTDDWSRMSAAISHEVSQPLETIGNLLYLIRTDTSSTSEQTRDLARQAQEEVNRVVVISRSMLQFHRESAAPEAISLRSVVESVRFLLESVIQGKRIDFQILGDEDLAIQAFPGETRQVVLNLARNACEATAEGTTVCLKLTRRDDGAELEIIDHGPGISPDILPHLFDFGRTTKGDQGNGLGLWTVRQIVQKHGGTIFADVHHQGGARFVAWWPMRYAAPEPVTLPLSPERSRSLAALSTHGVAS